MYINSKPFRIGGDKVLALTFYFFSSNTPLSRRCFSGKQVIHGELPLHTVTKVRGKKAVTYDVFGSWQTEPMPLLKVIDGVLPENSYGNIEIWKGSEKVLFRRLIPMPHSPR